jgi:hypothetical protein
MNCVGIGLRDAVAGQSGSRPNRERERRPPPIQLMRFCLNRFFNLSINAHPIRNWLTVKQLCESSLSFVGYFDVVDRLGIL